MICPRLIPDDLMGETILFALSWPLKHLVHVANRVPLFTAIRGLQRQQRRGLWTNQSL